ncbi:GNAT family N-acetyltransferase [Thomasclavelia saccharogumia]|uniref:GNAT family N-acetyltransferase n=1 Tax=Thomasclavelia saccharogumia TaxID=341225 RepID=UPI000479E1E6|nr:GNAT family N-acetyltransferase [Thomasclavelia saccharogumia]
MKIEYCEVLPNDAKRVIEYLNIVADQTTNLTFESDDNKLNEIQEMELIQEINDDPNSIMIVAKDDDQIVGLVSLNGNSKKRLKHHASLGISVLKDYWNQGIGSNLLSATIGYAIEAGLEIIDLEVVTDNMAAIVLYKKFGFEIIGRYDNYMKIGDEYLNVYLMNLYL